MILYIYCSRNKLISFFSVCFIISAACLYTSCDSSNYIFISTSEGGIVELSPNSAEYEVDTDVVLSAIPDPDYYFVGWGNVSEYLNGSYNNNSREIAITMPWQDISISAQFARVSNSWTVMVYIAADNSLSGYAEADINEIEAGLYNAVEGGNSSLSDDLKVIILYDTYGSYDTKLYQAVPDNTDNIASNEIPLSEMEYGYANELNLGDGETLKDFIEFCFDNYPSKYNALIFWNHGGGVKSIDLTGDGVTKEICQDYTASGYSDYLYLNELQTAVASTISGGDRFEVIGMDACLMGEVETAYELRNLADYFAASMANEWGDGWKYDLIFDAFTSAGNPPTAAEVAVDIVSQFQEATGGNTYFDHTMTAVDLSAMETLKTEIDDFGAALYTAYLGDGSLKTSFETIRDASMHFYNEASTSAQVSTPYTDLYSLLSGIISDGSFGGTVDTAASDARTALDNAVIACFADMNVLTTGAADYYETDASSAVRGLSIFTSLGEELYNDETQYARQYYWYTADSVLMEYTGTSYTYYMGGIDFCDYDTDGTVETWKELFEAWYDTSDTYRYGDF